MSTNHLKSILGDSLRSLAKLDEKNLVDFRSFTEKITAKYANIKIKPQSNDQYFQTYKLILNSWVVDQNFDGLSARLYRKIPNLLTIEFEGSTPLINVAGFFQSYIKSLKLKNDDRSARKLYKSILRNYKKLSNYCIDILDVIRPIILSSDNILCSVIKERHNKYGILNSDLVQKITEKIVLVDSNYKVDDILVDMGVSKDLRESDICESVGLLILKQCKVELSKLNSAVLDRALEYFINPNVNNKLYHEYLMNEIVHALLVNFVKQDPDTLIKEKISRFLDVYFGDPRGNPRWNTIPIEERKVVIRWKVGVTLSAFFKLLDDVAREDTVHEKHWKLRKLFWKELLDNDLITQAWIVLGSRYLTRKSLFLKEGVSHAIFSSHEGIETSHCAIILEVNNFIVSEWSHNGATRIFKSNNRNAPLFYENEYHPKDLKKLKRGEVGYATHSSTLRSDGLTIWEYNMRRALGIEKRSRR
jgi:hypothetical protein